MRNELLENPVEVRNAIPPPHFNDRRVVQRAQPVVPLSQIRTKLKLRRLWFLSGAFAVAMLLGAASALVAVRVKRIAANNEIPQIEEPQTAEVQAPLQPGQVENPEVVEEAVEEAPVTQPAKRVVVATKRPDPSAERPRMVGSHAEVQPSENEQLEQIREAVLYEQWQERRARRAARRERRNRGDLSRVDEIFEGPRRPDRRPE